MTIYENIYSVEVVLLHCLRPLTFYFATSTYLVPLPYVYRNIYSSNSGSFITNLRLSAYAGVSLISRILKIDRGQVRDL